MQKWLLLLVKKYPVQYDYLTNDTVLSSDDAMNELRVILDPSLTFAQHLSVSKAVRAHG